MGLKDLSLKIKIGECVELHTFEDSSSFLEMMLSFPVIKELV